MIFTAPFVAYLVTMYENLRAKAIASGLYKVQHNVNKLPPKPKKEERGDADLPAHFRYKWTNNEEGQNKTSGMPKPMLKFFQDVMTEMEKAMDKRRFDTLKAKHEAYRKAFCTHKGVLGNSQAESRRLKKLQEAGGVAVAAEPVVHAASLFGVEDDSE